MHTVSIIITHIKIVQFYSYRGASNFNVYVLSFTQNLPTGIIIFVKILHQSLPRISLFSQDFAPIGNTGIIIFIEVLGLGLWCLTSLLTTFQLHRGVQFY